MDFTELFEISRSGMDLQRLRLELIAANNANASVSRAPGEALYQPLKAVGIGPQFSDVMNHLQGNALQGDANSAQTGPALGVQSIHIIAEEVEPRRVHEPNHPHADEQGFVEYPNINPIDSTTRLMEATRLYEANVKVFNATKSMADDAFSIGK